MRKAVADTLLRQWFDISTKMSYSFVVLVIFICVRTAQFAPRLSEGTCCAPSVVQGEASVDGIDIQAGEVYKGYARFYYDEIELKTAKIVTIATEGKVPYTVSSVFDYAAGVTYVVQDGICNIIEITGDFAKQCVADDATYEGRMTFGSGDTKMEVDKYRVLFHKGRYDVVADQLVAPLNDKQCVLFGFYSTATAANWTGTAVTETGLFWNLQEEITDRSVFDPPAECLGKLKNTDTLFYKTGSFSYFGHKRFGRL